ncbi:MAG: TRAP transporter substrate-binding protein [Rhodospirillales bacterium]
MKRREFLKTAGVVGAVGAGAAAGAFTPAAPAVAKERIEINAVATWPRDYPGIGSGSQRAAQRIQDMSDGRIQVNYFAGGERVGPFDVFDEVASGNAEAYLSAEYYWKGKHPGWAYFTTVPFGLTMTEAQAWIRFGGGQELWDELAGKSGLKPFMCGGTGVQMGGWFKKEINTLEDLQGLKIRMSGLGGDVMSKLGASPVSLPGGQIYENLVSGAIDATEWVGPWNDQFMKLYEAAKYYYYPGMHEPGSVGVMSFNASFWGKLSKSDQALIHAACSAENDYMVAEHNAKNGDALATLIREHGVELRQFSDEIYDGFGKAASEVFEDVRAHDELAERIHTSFLRARENIGGWTRISDQAYIAQRERVLAAG